MKIITEEKLVIKSWCNEPEDSAIIQARNLANHPFAFHHIALMPDTHCGYGMPIGGVLATKSVVIPNAVGVDIGCGMLAQKTSILVEEFNTETLKKIMGDIRKVVPVGFNHQKEAQVDHTKYGPIEGYEIEKYFPIVSGQYQAGLKQLGTLGGGNHFIEIQKGDDGYIWFMVHSGSRNLGLKIAKHYNDLAKELNKKWASCVSEKQDLAFLPIDSIEGQLYLKEMSYALSFAQANRDLIAQRIIDSFLEHIHCDFDGMLINIHHNYAKMEHHFGQNVMIHRKGATSAYKDQLGIIPGSQGTASYIVKGKGNTASFQSCSHGAGRRMGRKQACNSLNLEQEKEALNNLNIVHSIRFQKDLDEAPSAYKDINVVMEEQKDLVDIVTKLTPLGVIKG